MPVLTVNGEVREKKLEKQASRLLGKHGFCQDGKPWYEMQPEQTQFEMTLIPLPDRGRFHRIPR